MGFVLLLGCGLACLGRIGRLRGVWVVRLGWAVVGGGDGRFDYADAAFLVAVEGSFASAAG